MTGQGAARRILGRAGSFRAVVALAGLTASATAMALVPVWMPAGYS
jgi:hypothetical protein